ncbi:MAG: hypothetical protein AAF311_15825 [Pseudomonadota bacterium]
MDVLTGADVLIVHCHRCGRTYRVAPHHLYARFPPFTSILDLEQRWMRCRGCGARGEGVLTWHVQQAFPPVREIGG